MDIEVITQIAIAIGIVLVFRILSSAASSIIIKILTYKKGGKKSVKKNPFYLPLKTIFTFIGIYIGLYMIKDVIALSGKAEVIIEKTMKIAMILFVAKSFAQGLNEKNIIVSKLRDKSSKDIDNITMNAILRTARIGIYILAGFMIISELGYNISGFITGIGISGVVLTLAAQDTAKSLIGGIAIFLDKPYKVGDYIKVDEYEGTVELIKFRSTNIRTLDDTVLHVPNSEMASASIINYGEIQKRRYYTKLMLELDTPLEKIKQTTEQIEYMLNNREDIVKDGNIRVRFEEIADNGYEISINAYIKETDYAEFLNVKENVNYEVMAILHKEGIELAYNTQTLYVKNS